MICPKCGHEMKDDMLYCEKCGEEIQFVPDFDPEIEQSISDTLSEIKIQDIVINNNGSEDYELLDNAEYQEEYSDMYSDNNYNNSNNNDYYEEEFDDGYNQNYSNNSNLEYDQNYDNNEYSNNEYYDESVEYYDDNDSNSQNDDINSYDSEYTDNYNDEYTDEYNNDYNNEYYEDNNGEYSEEYVDEDGYYIDGEYDEEYDDYEDDEEDEDDEEFLGDPFDDFEYEAHLIKKFINFLKYSKLKWVILLFLVLVIGLSAYGITKFTEKMKTDNSVDYQIQLANEAASNGDYASAIEYMEKALSLNSKDSSKKYVLADYYLMNNEDEKAMLMLWEIINEGGANSQAAYKKMINYYNDKGDFVMIEKILSNCKDDSIKLEFGNYLALEPEFNIPEGIYEDEVSIIISGDVGGTIYYTVDGSEPTMESDIFYSPIQLTDLGVYTISAFYVNQFGIASDVVKKTYTIDISTPKPPNVILDPGTYKIPMLIEVDVQNYCSVYYTTDGTLPTIFSNEYTGPIPMPIGQTHFIFIAMSQESVWSEVTEVDYNLEISSDIDLSEITQNLLNYEFVLGKAIDLQGHLLGNTTQYIYQISSALAYNKEDDTLVILDHGQEGEEDISDIEKVKEIDKDEINVYYVIVEQMIDTSGNTMKTGTLFLCDLETGALYNTQKDEDGYIIKTDEIPPEMYTLAIPEDQEEQAIIDSVENP